MLYLQVGMNVTSQRFTFGNDGLEQTVRLNLWDPAMRELTRNDTQEQELIGINEQLRVRHEKDCYFHGVIFCYDATDGDSFSQAVAAYK